MNKADMEKMAGGTLVKIAKDGKAHGGRVGQFRKLTDGAIQKAAVMIDGKIRYVDMDRISHANK